MPDPSSVHPTEPASAGSGDAATGRSQEVDPTRRRFFRQLAGELFQTAATVVGAASALQRTSAEAAQAILQPDEGAAALADAMARNGAMPSGFRTPFRLVEDGRALVLVDQRQLPDRLVEHRVASAAEAAWAVRNLLVRGAPAIGQVAALALALTADRARTIRPYGRRATLRGAANALTGARPAVANLRWAVDRVMERYREIGELTEDGDAVADAMRREADTIVYQATEDHGRLAGFGVEVLPVPDGRPLRLLTHGSTGVLAGGQFGTALGIIQVAHHAGREIHVWAGETRPSLVGGRIAAWELAQAGVSHSLIADAAAGWLLARGEVDAVLVGADAIAANGDTVNEIGTYPLAVLAARHDVPLYVCAPLSTLDPALVDGAGAGVEERAVEEVVVVAGMRIAPATTGGRNPSFDVTPAELISGIVTEEGVLLPPLGSALADARTRAAERWATAPVFGTRA